MGDEIHLAKFVTKRHTMALNAFASPGLGPVGRIAEGAVMLDVTPSSSEYVGLPPRLPHRVELIWMCAGSDGLLLELAAPNADGIVIAAMGGGHVPPSIVETIQATIAAGTPVIVASRCGAGPMLRHTYDGPGSETDLRDAGAIFARDVAPLKARLRLMVALALGLAPETAFHRDT
jgi:L-asparaginase